MTKSTTCVLQRLSLLSFWLTGVACVRILPHDYDYNSQAGYPKDDGQRRLVNVPIPKSPDDHLVTTLPYFDHSMMSAQWAGLLPASSTEDKFLFYWLFAPDTTTYPGNEDDIPLLLWLNGGPGCSSMDGLFIEHGPLQLQADAGTWKITERPFSWHKAPAYVLYLDQPVGTGLSFTTTNSYPRLDDAVNADFYYWLLQFFQLHADKFLNDAKNQVRRPFFFSGESHAGHYIPSMMAYIQKQQNPSIEIKLSGAAIGNGWVDPFYQYAAATAAFGHGIIDYSLQRDLNDQEKECQKELNQKNYVANVCFHLLDAVVDQSFGRNSPFKVSQYDVSKPESKINARNFPPGHKNIESYLGGAPTQSGLPKMTATVEEVLTALHAFPSRQSGQVYKECTDPPYTALSHQDGLGVTKEVIQLLDSDTRLLFFNGMLDLICNHVGNEVLLENLDWKSRTDWISAPRYSWTASSQNPALGVSGYVKEFGPLTFLKLKQAGHMVPMDLPEISLDMMKTFLYGGSFDMSEQVLDRKLADGTTTCQKCPDCSSTLDPDGNSNISQPAGLPGPDENPFFGFIIAHSWMGAILAVVIFLGVLVTMKRRQSRTTGSYADVEMNQHYRDEPASYLDDDHSESPKAEGRMV